MKLLLVPWYWLFAAAAMEDTDKLDYYVRLATGQSSSSSLPALAVDPASLGPPGYVADAEMSKAMAVVALPRRQSYTRNSWEHVTKNSIFANLRMLETQKMSSFENTGAEK